MIFSFNVKLIIALIDLWLIHDIFYIHQIISVTAEHVLVIN